jgi:signal peptidase I
MIKYLILIGLLLVSAPFWLPASLGGDNSYNFVLSDSMKGSVDPGALVVVRRADVYQVGDVVAFQLETGSGSSFTILHRIIGQLPDGRFLIKGDNASGVDTVEKEAINGRMVLAVPRVGLAPAMFRQAPHVYGGLFLAGLLLTGGGKKKGAPNAGGGKKGAPNADRRKGSLFLIVALVVLATIPYSTRDVADIIPFAAGGVGELLSVVPLSAWLLGVVGVTRLAEVTMAKGNSALVIEANYTLVMVLSLFFLPFPALLQSARTVLSF